MPKGKPAKRYSQAARVHDIVRLVEARHGMTIEELAEEAGVTRRTIHRDLAAIHEAGYPLVAEWEGGRKVYRFLARFKDVPPISLTLQELATLYLLRGVAEPLLGTPFEDELETIFRKVRSVLPPRYAAHLERIATVPFPLFQGRHDYHGFTQIIATLRDALVYQKRVTIRYLATGKKRVTVYQVDPYTLIFYKGGLYLLGFAHNRQALRTFAVERLREVEVSDARFELPADYRPEERLKDAFGIVAEEAMAVRVRFAPEIAHGVRSRIWHPSQRLVELADGGVELSFAAGGRMEILAWLLSYGDRVEVLEPAELRLAVMETARRMLLHYGAAEAGGPGREAG